MGTGLLKKIRIVLAILFFIPVTYILIDFTNSVSSHLFNTILFFQFVPSLLKSILLFSFTSAGFIIIILLTVLFGRIYCSTICPLGILQDIINYIAKKKRKRKLSFIKPNKIVKITLTAIPFLLVIAGAATGFLVLDPYSIYGRIAGNFLRPAAIFINNLVSSLLSYFDVYSVYPAEIKAFNAIPFLVAFLYLVFIAYLAFTKGRHYCNLICPVGTLLGLMSRYSFFKIRIKNEDCLSCGLCERDCKGNCIDSENKKVEHENCVMCFNCISACPTKGIVYSTGYSSKSNKTETDEGKRNFIIKSAVYFSSLTFLGQKLQKKIVVAKPSTVPVFRKYAVSPPGSKSLERFNNSCTACHLCISACPTQVLQPSFLEYGLNGMLQPRLDNNAGFCNFDCVTCGEVCPTGAIMPLTVEEKKLTQLGVAKFIEDNCVVKTQNTDCGACAEHCPTKAVHMIPYKNNLFIPEVREDYCIGCGACEHACPVKPYKAIYVEGNAVHKTAKINPESEDKHQEIDTGAEFPF
ncbi:ferredoxin-type protein [Melioribacter roseus P3M-2]|uniref:Ferredoxin-type protein n=1 Tax=Melioribacter roseus (strain DSM 23840 / JCM 17771 / VKM B-2668 / P3M-2) TaxID=1191523 RepID=I6Z6V1_MELRP|nr:4Fe-4S binding protein [Melioribacter roseus]AFN74885.1 ferredoxin-type protein [Melioribacter roseus P3M-2]